MAVVLGFKTDLVEGLDTTDFQLVGQLAVDSCVCHYSE